METVTLVVPCLQASDEGQHILKISGIFNFDVPLRLTRIRSYLVSTHDGSPNI